MKVIYANICYDPAVSTGGNAHVFQFIRNAHELGHEVWTWPYVKHPDSFKFSGSRLTKLQVMRGCDAIIFRIEDYVPRRIHMMNFVYRLMLGSPKYVWEFNTIPEFGLTYGKSQDEVDGTIKKLREYAHLCDLAVCVSDNLAGYVRDTIGVKNVLAVPNGSDPDLFRPDCPVAPPTNSLDASLNLVWIGSAFLDWVDFEILQNAAQMVWDSDMRDKVFFHVIGDRMPSIDDLPSNIHYHGAKLYGELPGWLAVMDVGLVAYKPGQSDYNSPLKLFDYLASGLAVLATGQPQATSVLNELGQQDSILKPGDASGLVSRLKVFLENPELLEKCKEESRSLAVRKYSWANTVSTVFDAIDKI